MIWQPKKAPLSPACPVCQWAGPAMSSPGDTPSQPALVAPVSQRLPFGFLSWKYFTFFFFFFFFRDWTAAGTSCFPGCCRYFCLLSQHLKPRWTQLKAGPLVQSPQLTHHGELKIHPAALPTLGRAFLCPLFLWSSWFTWSNQTLAHSHGLSVQWTRSEH